MQIDTYQIECFLSVAEHLNFTIAANELFISQPAISRKVAALEKELTMVLIDRSNRELKLTEEGKSFQKFFRKFMNQLEDMKSSPKEIDENQFIEIRLGIFEGWNISPFLRKLRADFKVTHENIVFNIDTCGERNLIIGLKENKYDIVILLKISIKCALNRGIIDDVNVFDFAKVHKAAFYSVHNTLADESFLNIDALSKQTLYVHKSDIVPYEIIMNKEILIKYGINSKVRVLSTLDAVINEIALGNGYALFDEQMRITNNIEFKYTKLKEQHDISIVALKSNKTEGVDAVLKYCQSINLREFKL